MRSLTVSPGNGQGPHRIARVPDFATFGVVQHDTGAFLPGWNADGKEPCRVACTIDKHKALGRHQVANLQRFGSAADSLLLLRRPRRLPR